jgi:drug/metabolite transporter (DMT)-like permease
LTKTHIIDIIYKLVFLYVKELRAMLLILSFILASISWLVAWYVAYRLADPSQPLSYSKFVGSMAGAASMPFLIFCAVLWIEELPSWHAGIGIFGVILAVAFASVRGEQRGQLRTKSQA